MSFEQIKAWFGTIGMEDRVRHFEVSSATVELAAQAVGTAPAQIAKTLSFLVDEQPILIVAAGDAKIDNKKYKELFHKKAKMIPPEEVEGLVGHAPGGVCPFLTHPGVVSYLDRSLQRFEIVYPAAGDARSAVELSPDELSRILPDAEWIDVCKLPE